MTKIKKCHCTHVYQDYMYGPGQRVMNSTAPAADGTVNWRCTVCSRVHLTGGEKGDTNVT